MLRQVLRASLPVRRFVHNGAVIRPGCLRHFVQRLRSTDARFFSRAQKQRESSKTILFGEVLATRIKGRGRRWDAAHIEAVMALLSLDVCEEWQAYWQSQTSVVVQRL